MVAAAVVLVVTAGVLALLALPLSAAIGPFYWDTLIYYDAAARIADGQIPTVDFLTPVGPLSYWLFSAVLSLFPDAQGAFAASWSILLLTGPLMAIIAHDVARRTPGKAALIALPFLVFSVLPFNVEQFYPYPGIDGYGIYNRHTSQLLYALLAALLFIDRPVARILSLVLALSGLFLIKITGFLVALPLVALAVVAGRLRLREAAIAIALFGLVLIGLEIHAGITGAYLGSIMQLIRLNETSLSYHLIHGTGRNIGIVLITGLLLLALVTVERQSLLRWPGEFLRHPSGGAISALAARPWVWLAATLIGGTLLESQNWGGQAFIFLWPVVIFCLDERAAWPLAPGRAIMALAALCLLPDLADISGRAVRTFLAQTRYTRLEIAELGPLSSVSKTPSITERVKLLRTLAVAHPGYHAGYAEAGALPYYNLYAQPEFQLAWLRSIGEGVAAIRRAEADRRQRFETILSLNFVNPFPYLMDRRGPEHVAIGADPFRTVAPPGPAALGELQQTDLILWPKCPETAANRKLRRIYAAGLEGRETIALSPCWDGYVLAKDAPARPATGTRPYRDRPDEAQISAAEPDPDAVTTMID